MKLRQDVLLTLEEIRKSIKQAEYLSGSSYWETKRRWDIQGKLIYALSQVLELEKILNSD